MSSSISKTRTILVCGATGNTGKAVIQELLKNLGNNDQAAINVLALVRDPASEKAKALQKMGNVTLVQGSFDDVKSLESACHGVDACYLSCSNQENQVELETNVIMAANASSSCQYLIKLSTCGATSETVGPYIGKESLIEYGRFHAAIEETLSTKCPNLKYTVLRPNCFMQNHIGDIFAMIPKKTLVYPHGDPAAATLIDTRDVGTIAAKLLLLPDDKVSGHYGKFYNICGPRAWTVQALAAEYTKQLPGNPTIETKVCDFDSFENWLVQVAGFPAWFAKAVTINHTEYWAKGHLNYPSSPEIIALLHPQQFRTMEEWIAEHVPLVPR
jgi:uncharacterized protein YbjT (DUF2867 family)